jgi:hypothetical protein
LALPVQNVSLEHALVVFQGLRINAFVRSGWQTGLGLVDNGHKCRLIGDGQIGQHFAVNLDSGNFQTLHQPTVGNVICPCRRIDASYPKAPENALLGFPISVGILASLCDGLFCNTKDTAAGSAVTFRLLKDFLVTGAGGYATFYSWHCLLTLAIVWQHAFYKNHVIFMDHIATAKLTLSLCAFLGQNMAHVRILAFVTTRTGSLEPLGRSRDGLLLVRHCLTPAIGADLQRTRLLRPVTS